MADPPTIMAGWMPICIVIIRNSDIAKVSANNTVAKCFIRVVYHSLGPSIDLLWNVNLVRTSLSLGAEIFNNLMSFMINACDWYKVSYS